MQEVISELRVVAPACYPSAQEAEAGGLAVSSRTRATEKRKGEERIKDNIAELVICIYLICIYLIAVYYQE